jgi:hypothetical protein
MVSTCDRRRGNFGASILLYMQISLPTTIPDMHMK